MAVPLPLRIPVTVVERVIAGVVVGLATVPENPFAETTETESTVPVPPGRSTFTRCVVGSTYTVTGVTPSADEVPSSTGTLLLSLGAEMFAMLVAVDE